MGFLLGNKYLAIAKWIAIAAAVWYIFHTWDKAQGYDALKEQLTAETSCAIRSVCSERSEKAANEKKQAVQAVKDAADKQNAQTKADQQAKEDAREQQHQEVVKQLQSKVTERDKKLAEIATHDKPCRDWLNEVLPECVF